MDEDRMDKLRDAVKARFPGQVHPDGYVSPDLGYWRWWRDWQLASPEVRIQMEKDVLS